MSAQPKYEWDYQYYELCIARRAREADLGVAKLTQKEKGGHPSLICGTILAGVDPSRREGR